MWQVGCCHVLCNANHIVTRSVFSLKCSSMVFQKVWPSSSGWSLQVSRAWSCRHRRPSRTCRHRRPGRTGGLLGRPGRTEANKASLKRELTLAKHRTAYEMVPPLPLGFACGTAALPGFSSDSVVASLMAFKPRIAS